MTRTFTGSRLLVASHNAGKVLEIIKLLEGLSIAVVSASDLSLAEPEETANSFIGNAELKALAGARASGIPALADDSGLVVHALAGNPGIYSARWAGPNKDFTMAMHKVEDALVCLESKTGAVPSRRASFVCALSFAWPDGHVETVEGEVSGQLVWPPRGDAGFGYDPIFVPEGHDKTFGEIEPDLKHSLSHRADAFTKMLASVFGKNG
ncbi:MAG: non-canonical purine NTP pyrophosphatase, RdgB/HAM1 family [Rhodospirillaceae bacterium]|nr:non-canonical purine NTP pyrophosphatase, RdgB/HAM1 family [Rhodospirillaceae bacterium]